MSQLPGKFVWFEHASADVGKARQFYGDLFGWHAESMPLGEMTYHMILNGSGGIGGFTTQEGGRPAQWLSYVAVEDVDRTFAAATAAGATGVLPPTAYGDVGRGAVIVDPQGAAVAFWKSTQGDRPDLERVPDGDWYWNELSAPDAPKAVAFYERLIGWTHDEMPMGEHGTYYVLKTGDKPRAGVMRAVDGQPTMWTPYVHVADCDASAAKAAQLGASTAVPPTDIPGVGRFAVLVDPQGATFAVIKSAA